MSRKATTEATPTIGRREFLARGGALGLAVPVMGISPSWGAAAQTRRPNILWILAEDMSPHFNVYGEKLTTTPCVDRLASEGTLFSNAFVTAPVCSPSRSAVITGMYQTTIGAHNHQSSRGPTKIHLPTGMHTLPDLFREHGYYVTNGAFPETPQNPKYRQGKTDYNFEYPAELYDGADWSNRQPGQPFFAQVQLRGGKFRSRPQRVGREQRTRPRVWWDPAKAPKPIDPGRVTLPPYYPDDPLLREHWADYLDSVNYVDQEIDQILARLAREGELDNTVVFFWTDHGVSHARGKQFLYEEGIRVPLIVRAPGRVERGAVRRDLVAHIDIAATSLDFAGISVPGYMEGRPLFDPKAKPRELVVSARDRCDETVEHIRSVRTARYKYIRNYYPQRPHLQPNSYKDGKLILHRLRELHGAGKLNAVQERVLFSPSRAREELYDLQKDAWELNNLAGQAAYRKVLTEHSGMLDRWIRESGDKGEVPEKDYDGEMQVRLADQGDVDDRRVVERNIATMKRWAEEGK